MAEVSVVYIVLIHNCKLSQRIVRLTMKKLHISVVLQVLCSQKPSVIYYCDIEYHTVIFDTVLLEKP